MRTELRRERWRRLTAGVLLTRPDEPTRDDWVQVGMLIGGPQAALSGWDAVRLRSLGPERPVSPLVLVLVRSGHNRVLGGLHLRPTTRRTRITRIHDPDERIPGVRIASTARSVCDTALLCSWLDPVRAMVTSSVQRQLCTADELAAELAGCPRNGSAHLRRAVSDVLGGAASIAEAELADLMRGASLPAFELNVRILDENGRHVATADALWRELRAVLEVDSRRHHFLEPQWRRTMMRHNMLTRGGLAVAHYPPSELRERGPGAMNEIEQWLRGRAAELSLEYPPAPTREHSGRPFNLNSL